jgi:hypothetical protein
MKYTLFLYNDESAYAHLTPAQMEASVGAFQAYTKSLIDAGVFVATDWLKPSLSATTVTLRTGEKQIQDGPFASSKEQLGGYYVIEVPNLDVALEWAEKCPAAAFGVVEIRPSQMG